MIFMLLMKTTLCHLGNTQNTKWSYHFVRKAKCLFGLSINKANCMPTSFLCDLFRSLILIGALDKTKVQILEGLFYT